MAVPLLLLVVFDGLGHDIIREHYQSFGNISRFYNASPKVKYGVQPVFPTFTTPNLYSIATGLYSESHGVTANDMKAHQHELDKYNNIEFHLFSASDEDATWWDNGLNVPIWTLNELQSTSSQPRYSGGMLWAGSGAPIRKKVISHYYAYEANISWFKEVDIVIKWLSDPQKPANCVFLYFEEPDVVLHDFGEQSKEFLKMMERVDNVLGYLMNKIEEHNLNDRLNIIVTADHGMARVPVENYNEIDQLNIPREWYEVYQNSVTWDIHPLPEYFDEVYEAFKEGSSRMNFSVWKIEDFPQNANFRKASHAPPIQLVTDVGFRTFFKKPNVSSAVGWHGYNNTHLEMRSLFMAQGPAFNASGEIEYFEIVDLYPLMCNILELIPIMPNNGSLERVIAILNNSSAKYSWSYFIPFVMLAVLLLCAIWCASTRLYRKGKRKSEGIIGTSDGFKKLK